MAPDQNLEGWIDQLYGQEAPRLSAGDLYALTMRGGLHHIRHGVTTVFNLTFTGADKSGTAASCAARSTPVYGSCTASTSVGSATSGPWTMPAHARPSSCNGQPGSPSASAIWGPPSPGREPTTMPRSRHARRRCSCGNSG
ncbi:hypothetical protein ACI2VH_24720 [Ralstonia nicotianae]|uniref:hypothetical protein n=1 Tax=Ralstonia nicotianae TaxID=3037696 RepID=UPI0024079447|nr:hypothetical protein [Ralstonia nicotianae]